MAESSGPPVGVLANGAAFVPPEYYNLPGFNYPSLQAQMADAAQTWAKGAGMFAGNNVPKFTGSPGITFGGGMTTMPPNVGGGLLGASAYSGGFNPFAGRGNGPPAGGGTPPPPGGSTPPPSGGFPSYPTPGTSPMPTNPLPPNPSPPLPGTQVPPRIRPPAAPGAPVNTGPIGGGPRAGAAPVTGVPPYSANNWGSDGLPSQGSQTDLLARTMAASGDWNVGNTQLQGLLGSNEAMHQAGNAYNAGGSRYGDVWSINYAAVAQNPEAYVNAGIAKPNGDGTYTMLKLQDKESQQWIPIAEFEAKYGKGA